MMFSLRGESAGRRDEPFCSTLLMSRTCACVTMYTCKDAIRVSETNQIFVLVLLLALSAECQLASRTLLP